MSTNTILATTPLVSTNYLLRATGTTIGNSLIWDNGTNVGIGNTNTSYTLDVSGTGRFTSSLTATKVILSLGANQAELTNSVNNDFKLTNSGNFRIINNANTVALLTITNAGAATFSSSVGIVGAAGTNGSKLFVQGSASCLFDAAGTRGISFYPSQSSVHLITSDYIGTSYYPLALSSRGVNTDLYLSTNGNVGIGASPLAKFFVNIATNQNIRFSQEGSQACISVVNDLANAFGVLKLDGSTLLLNSQTGGNVGIGITTGTGKVYVKQTTANFYDGINCYASNSDSFVGIGHAGALAVINSSYNSSGAYYPLAFYTSDTERMRITSGGNVGINANGTNAQLDIKSSTNSNPVIYGYNTSSAPYGMRIIYSTTPNNSDNWFLYADDSTTQRFSVRSNGGVYNFTANNSNLSDERLKKDIVSLESVWDKIKGIEIVKYKYIDQSHDDYNMGVIAQQVETIAPELVNPDGWGTLAEDGTPYKSIYESDLNYYTIKVLQEAMTKIEEQQIQIQNLQEQINILAK